MTYKKTGFLFFITIFTYLFNSMFVYSEQTDIDFFSSEQIIKLEEKAKYTIGEHELKIAKLESCLKELIKKAGELRDTKQKLNPDNINEKKIISALPDKNEVIKAKIEVLNALITSQKSLHEEAGKLKKCLDSLSELKRKMLLIDDDAAILSTSQHESLKMGIELLNANLKALKAAEKEKKALLDGTKADVDAAKLKIKKANYEKDLNGLENTKTESVEEFKLIKSKIEYLKEQISLQNDELDLLETSTKLAELRLDIVQTQIFNIGIEIGTKTKIISILSERLKKEEVEKKVIEIEKEKILEEEIKQLAVIQKEKIELEKNRALKKVEISEKKQLNESSPEKKRVLELETDIYKNNGLIATLKDDLITEDTERFKDRIEFKKSLHMVENLLNGNNTPKEIADDLAAIEIEAKRGVDKTNTIKELIAATETHRNIVTGNLNKASTEVIPVVPGEKSLLEKETEAFSDQILAEQLIKLSNMRLNQLEKQNNLVSTRIERLNERLELAKIHLATLNETKGKLSQIKAANVWTRQEKNISTKTLIVPFIDLKIIMETGLGIYLDSVNGIIKLKSYLSDKKNIPLFILKIFILSVVILLLYFIRRYIKRLAKTKIDGLACQMHERFFIPKLVTGLLYIMQRTLTFAFLFLISLTIVYTVPTNAPIVHSFKNLFAIIAIYKLLKGLLIESLSPYIGFRRWTSIAYFYAKRLFGGLSFLLTFTLIILSLISVLTTYNYKKDVIELLWVIYRIATIFLVIWIATSQRSILLKKILPSKDIAFNKFINKFINIVYPLIFTYIIFLISLRDLGYIQLSLTLTITSIKAVIIICIAYLIYWLSARQLSTSKKRKINEEKTFHSESFLHEENALNSKFKIYKNLIAYSVLIITAIIIIGICINTFKDVVNSPAAPKLFRGLYDNIVYLIVSIKGSLSHQFVVAEGTTTTPFRILFGIFALIVAFIGSKFLKNSLKKKIFEKRKMELGSQHAITSIMTYIIIGIASIIGLNIAGIPLKSLTIFAGAFGIGIGFGMQNIINNLVSGIIILFERPIKVGDAVSVDNIKGIVESISIRSTVIKAYDRTSVIVPNSKFLESNVINWVHDKDMILRAIMPVGVAYGSDTVLVKECLLTIAKAHPDVLSDPEPVVRFAEFGDSSLIFQLYIWAHIDKRWMAISDINFEIERIFRENKLEIAFPQMDIHIRSITKNEEGFAKTI